MILLRVEAFIERWLSPLLIAVGAAWGIYMLYIKFELLRWGLATDDLFNYVNGLYNTNFVDQWMFTARYEVRGLPTLLLDHWQPTVLVLWPILHLFGTESLLVVQALGPLWAAFFLHKITAHLELPPLDRLFVLMVALFHPAMMAATMDSLYGFHGTSMMLYFGAPLAWAAITGRWGLALVLLFFFVNVRENATFYVFGAAAGYLVFKNRYFATYRHVAIAALIALGVLAVAIYFAPMIAEISRPHTNRAVTALMNPPLMLERIINMDPDWHNLFLWLWPAFAALGTLAAMLPDAFILIIVNNKASHWYGMALVLAGAIAVAFGIKRLRRVAQERGKANVLSWILILHMTGIAFAGVKEVNGQTNKLITRMGYEVPMSSKQAARAAVDTACRVAVDLPLMYGFGDLAYLQTQSQAQFARYLVVSREQSPVLTPWIERHREDLTLIYEDEYLQAFENPGKPCR